MAQDIYAALGEFQHPDDSRMTPGTLTIDDGVGLLELIGCLEIDQLPADTNGGGYPRPIPGIGKHPVVNGLLRSGEAVTLVGVSGQASKALNMRNGVGWEREDRFSGDVVRLHAEHTVLGAIEDTEPEFDAIAFTLPELDAMLGRNRPWMPTATTIDEVAGFVPVVIPSIPDYEFAHGRFTFEFRQVRKTGPDRRLFEIASTMFSIRTSEGPTLISDCVDTLNDLRLLAEFSCLAHVPMGALTGLRNTDERPRPDEYPIHSWTQQNRAQGEPTLRLTFHRLYPSNDKISIPTFASAISAEDPNRAGLITRWLDWIAIEGNRDVLIAFLEPFHSSRGPRRAELYKNTIGVLEEMCDLPASAPRVAPVPDAEVELREKAVEAASQAFGAADVDPETASWATERLRSGTTGKGLARKLRELFAPHAESLHPILRSERYSRDPENTETTNKLARALTSLRGALSHGTATGPTNSAWRVDQAALVFFAIVLDELGYEPHVVGSIIRPKSGQEDWWKYQRHRRRRPAGH